MLINCTELSIENQNRFTKENMKNFGILVQNGDKQLHWIYTETF